MKKQEVNVYSVLGNANQELARELRDTNYYIVGGVVSNILADSETSYDLAHRLVQPRPNLELSNYRTDGTIRDLDILILSPLSSSHLKYLEKVVLESVEGLLIPSVFALKEHEQKRNALKANLLDWVSRRTIDENGVLRYELFPLSQEVSRESYEPWHFQTKNSLRPVPILHPVAHLAAYRIRSISGLRAKDKQKVELMELNIKNNAPELFENLDETGLIEWFRFSESIKNMIESDTKFGSKDTLDEFIFKSKSKLLNFVESNPKMVTLSYNKFISKILNSIMRS